MAYGMKRRHTGTGKIINTPTHFGTTADMVVTDEEVLGKATLPENFILCQDDQGYYITNTSRVDNGFADTNRYCEGLRDKLIAGVFNDG